MLREPTDTIALTEGGTRVIVMMLHPRPHEDLTYCVAISIENHSMLGSRSNMLRSMLTIEEILDVVENPGQAPRLSSY